MRILLTGATGYIGSNLLKVLLSKGILVSILKLKGTFLPFEHQNKLEFIEYEYDGSLKSIEEAFKNHDYNIVIHVAAMVLGDHKKEDIDNLINSNIIFGTQLLEVMRNYKVTRFINTSTYWIHYNNEAYNPVNLYAATKKAFEDIIRFYHERYEISVITLELYDNYGPMDPRRKIFYWLKKSLSSDRPIDITNGEQVLSFVHINDVVDAYLHTIKLINNNQKKFNSYAVKSTHTIKLLDLISIFEETSGKKLNISIGGRHYSKREVMHSYDVAPILPGWSAKIKLKQGILEYIIN